MRYVANILFVFLVARPLTVGELMVLNFLTQITQLAF